MEALILSEATDQGPKIMPQRSSLYTSLSWKLREELDAKLIANGFAGYRALSQWLADNGCRVSESTVQRYGQHLKKDLQAIEIVNAEAKAIVAAAPDNDGAMNDALTRLVQHKLFAVLKQLSLIDIKKVSLGVLARIIATLGRASIDQKRFEHEMRSLLAAKAKADKKAAGPTTGGGIPMETAEKIRNALLGIEETNDPTAPQPPHDPQLRPR
ncbi:MAG: phage protein Gp27 family protein [Candidatus Binataceae bacterium]